MDKANAMTIKQAQRLLGCKNEFQLAKKLDLNYQAIQYWRKKMDSRLPHPWPDVVRARAVA